jgi:hypothetical protein
MSGIDFDGFTQAGLAAGLNPDQIREEALAEVFKAARSGGSPAAARKPDDKLTPFRRNTKTDNQLALDALMHGGMQELRARTILMEDGIPEVLAEDVARRRLEDTAEIERDAYVSWANTQGGRLAIAAEMRQEQEQQAAWEHELGADARVLLIANGAPPQTVEELSDAEAIRYAKFDSPATSEEV